MTGINPRAVAATSGGSLPGPITIRTEPRFLRSDQMSSSNEAHDPNKLGWGFAAAIIVLAIVANVAAYSTHKATYLKPDKAVPAAGAAAH